jgi:hypothetical protein
MTTTPQHDARMAALTLAEVYPHYKNKIERKGRTESELQQVIQWLTGFNESQINTFIQDKSTFKTIFSQAHLHPNASQIRGVICGYRIENIENQLTKQIRYLDKLVDELAQGKALEKIMRS